MILRAIAVAVLATTALAACVGDTPESPPTTIEAVEVGNIEESDVVQAANEFINALSSDQRSVAILAFDSPLRPNWSNLPPGMPGFDRNGVRIGDLDADQVELMHRFLKTALSVDGYTTIVEIVGAEDVLASKSRAGSTRWSADNYWLAFFGEPSAVKPWAWQFGGHHLAVNVTVIGGRSYLSPTFLGIEPATYDAGGYTAAPLAGEVEAGLALINSLAGDSLSAAQVETQPGELWAGAGKDGVIPPLEGSKVSEWNSSQQSLLMDAVALWVGLLPAASAEVRLGEIRADLDSTHFAWHGDANGHGSIYYRIQGPSLIIEFSARGNVGSDAGHYHSIYRDPTNEYGSIATNSN